MQLEVSQGLELNIMAESIDQNIRNKMSKNMCLGTYYDNIQLLIKITSLHANVKISSLLNYPVILVPEFTSETEEYCKNHKSVALISSVGDYEEYEHNVARKSDKVTQEVFDYRIYSSSNRPDDE
ncbi:2838_t:CDS:2 [Rhizophagus irregularis]|nr:2838_t:CDS:2 [Rhizophagus irregularis]